MQQKKINHKKKKKKKKRSKTYLLLKLQIIIRKQYLAILHTGCWLVGFYDISTFVGYLKPNPFLCK